MRHGNPRVSEGRPCESSDCWWRCPRLEEKRVGISRTYAGSDVALSRLLLSSYHTRLCLRHAGDVTVVLSKKGRNMGPHNTKLLVTNLAALTPSQVVCIYQKRWAIDAPALGVEIGLGIG